MEFKCIGTSPVLTLHDMLCLITHIETILSPKGTSQFQFKTSRWTESIVYNLYSTFYKYLHSIFELLVALDTTFSAIYVP